MGKSRKFEIWFSELVRSRVTPTRRTYMGKSRKFKIWFSELVRSRVTLTRRTYMGKSQAPGRTQGAFHCEEG